MNISIERLQVWQQMVEGRKDRLRRPSGSRCSAHTSPSVSIPRSRSSNSFPANTLRTDWSRPVSSHLEERFGVNRYRDVLAQQHTAAFAL